MTEISIPAELVDLVSVRDVGCTGVTLRALHELEKIADNPERLLRCVAFLRRELGGYASLWQLEHALTEDDPRRALPRFADQVKRDADAAVETAHQLLKAQPGAVVSAPSSGITRRLLERLGRRDGEARIGVCGADAVGPKEILNIVGTRGLAGKLPTVVVTTRDRFVPGDVFAGLGTPLFERIPLTLFDAVVVGDEVLTPAEAGARAASLG